jgi:hypothetical protein
LVVGGAGHPTGVSQTLERGDLFFFYRLRVGEDRVDDLDEVQRFFFVLKPDGRPRYRRVVVGPKRLPDPLRHERAWAFVAEVAERWADLRDDVERKEYETRTRGVRVQPEARAAGEARYALVDHDGHTHLAYVLELPREPGEAQAELNILREASYVVAVRNPEAPAPPGAGLQPHRRAQYPPELLDRFGGRRFAAVDPPEFLDHEGAELVLIGAAEDPVRELGVQIDAEAERLEQADVFRELRLHRGEIRTEPLETGELR